MANYWNISGVPHKGWVYETIIDLKEDGQDYETCMMCGQENIRYVHLLSHDEVDDLFRVGCNCAEKMTGDYVNPKERQKQIESRARRKETWKYKDWKQSKNGNHFYNLEEHHLLIYQDKKTNKFKCKIDETFGSKTYQYLSEAKAAIFTKIEEMKDKGVW